MLKINILPPSGGDTHWINCYDVSSYIRSLPHGVTNPPPQILDKMSPSFLAYLETLKCRHNAQFFHAEAEKLGITVRDDIERGNPLNKGSVLTADHPVIRTNPVTGWKALFVNRGFSDRILDVTKDESDFIYEYVNKIGESFSL